MFKSARIIAAVSLLVAVVSWVPSSGAAVSMQIESERSAPVAPWVGGIIDGEDPVGKSLAVVASWLAIFGRAR